VFTIKQGGRREGYFILFVSRIEEKDEHQLKSQEKGHSGDGMMGGLLLITNALVQALSLISVNDVPFNRQQ
jgi:hypothetical protein